MHLNGLLPAVLNSVAHAFCARYSEEAPLPLMFTPVHTDFVIFFALATPGAAMAARAATETAHAVKPRRAVNDLIVVSFLSIG
jgi:hypothetical protein